MVSKSVIMIITILALILTVSACTKQVTPQPVNNPVDTTGAAANTANDLNSAVSMDTPTDPGTLDNVTVSDSVPQ